MFPSKRSLTTVVFFLIVAVVSHCAGSIHTATPGPAGTSSTELESNVERWRTLLSQVAASRDALLPLVEDLVVVVAGDDVDQPGRKGDRIDDSGGVLIGESLETDENWVLNEQQATVVVGNGQLPFVSGATAQCVVASVIGSAGFGLGHRSWAPSPLSAFEYMFGLLVSRVVSSEAELRYGLLSQRSAQEAGIGDGNGQHSVVWRVQDEHHRHDNRPGTKAVRKRQRQAVDRLFSALDAVQFELGTSGTTKGAGNVRRANEGYYTNPSPQGSDAKLTALQRQALNWSGSTCDAAHYPGTNGRNSVDGWCAALLHVRSTAELPASSKLLASNMRWYTDIRLLLQWSMALEGVADVAELADSFLVAGWADSASTTREQTQEQQTGLEGAKFDDVGEAVDDSYSSIDSSEGVQFDEGADLSDDRAFRGKDSPFVVVIVLSVFAITLMLLLWRLVQIAVNLGNPYDEEDSIYRPAK